MEPQLVEVSKWGSQLRFILHYLKFCCGFSLRVYLQSLKMMGVSEIIFLTVCKSLEPTVIIETAAVENGADSKQHRTPDSKDFPMLEGSHQAERPQHFMSPWTHTSLLYQTLCKFPRNLSHKVRGAQNTRARKSCFEITQSLIISQQNLQGQVPWGKIWPYNPLFLSLGLIRPNVKGQVQRPKKLEFPSSLLYTCYIHRLKHVQFHFQPPLFL